MNIRTVQELPGTNRDLATAQSNDTLGEVAVFMQHAGQNAVRYVVTRDGDRCVFRASELFAGFMVAMFAAGSALFVWLAVSMFRGSGDGSAAAWFGGILLVLAGQLAGLAIWAWRTRNIPLTVERGGRVCYGARELCAAGTVQAVRIAPARGGDSGDYEVYLELNSGKRVSLPSPYFPGFNTKEQAFSLAQALATALGVEVLESASPLYDLFCKYTERLCRRFFS